MLSLHRRGQSPTPIITKVRRTSSQNSKIRQMQNLSRVKMFQCAISSQLYLLVYVSCLLLFFRAMADQILFPGLSFSCGPDDYHG